MGPLAHAPLSMDLSIVIPAFDEATKIEQDLRSADAFFQKQQFAGEIFLADDGSTDGTADTAERVARQLATATTVLRLPHRGKGSAVRNGILASRGEFVLFADAGSCVPLDDCLRPLEWLRTGRCDIAHGSRRLPASRIELPQPLARRLISSAFRLIALRPLDLPRHLTDTQCGFKLYRGDVARELYRLCTTDGFLFDLEILQLAGQRGCRVEEFSIHWTCDRDSRLQPGRSLPSLLLELGRLRKRNLQRASTSDACRRA